MVKKMKNKDYSSFRDPSGYIYYEGDLVYRKVNACYRDTFIKFNSSKLCRELFDNNMLIKHRIVNDKKDITLEVDRVPFISYPYEWSFNQLRDAALLTLNIEKMALNHDFTLKDASAYNIQFIGGRPIFIDTLSFDEYIEGSTWGAYGQFCRHFVAPLVLMANVDQNLNCLLKNYIDGIPLDITSNILKNRGGLIALEHIKLHNKSIKKNNKKDVKNISISKDKVIRIIDMLVMQISNLKLKISFTEWGDYYSNTNYSDKSFEDKKKILDNYLDGISIDSDDIICDMGANDGTFSKIASSKGAYVLALDIDYNAVSNNYLDNSDDRILPLLFDFNNPSPAIGFNLDERKSIIDRIDAKCVMCLALIHHVCISNNIPFSYFFESVSKMGKYLIIEFVPKEDSKVQELLKTREDIFDEYDVEHFESAAKKYYNILEKKCVKDSKRILYLMEKNNG